MLRKFLLTTAAAALMTSGAIAADSNSAATDKASKTDETVAFSPMPDQFLASELMGISVYAGTGDNAERIGEVSNAILSPSGTVEAVVVDVGGFLGIGEKPVALDYDMASWSKDEDGHGSLTFAVEKEVLENAKAFDEEKFEQAEVGDAEKTKEVATTGTDKSAQPETDATESLENRMAAGEATDKPETKVDDQKSAEQGVTEKQKSEQDMASNADKPANAEDQQPMPEKQTTAENDRPSIRDGLSQVTVVDMTADDLIGATVLGENDQNIGEIGDIVLSSEEKIDAYIVEVGGFLGIGEKPVAIDAADLNVMSDKNGNLYVFTPFTQEELENQPEFDKTAYDENREGNVLRKNQ